MSNFDDYLKRTEDELKAARESAKTKAETEVQRKRQVVALSKTVVNFYRTSKGTP
jgi:hypothetical protein